MNEKTALERTYYFLQANGFKEVGYYGAHSPCVINAEKDGLFYNVTVVYSKDDSENNLEVNWSKLEEMISIPSTYKNHRVLLMFLSNSGSCLFEMLGGRVFVSEYPPKSNSLKEKARQPKK